jgi:hypothetical protein
MNRASRCLGVSEIDINRGGRGLRSGGEPLRTGPQCSCAPSPGQSSLESAV